MVPILVLETKLSFIKVRQKAHCLKFTICKDFGLLSNLAIDKLGCISIKRHGMVENTNLQQKVELKITRYLIFFFFLVSPANR